jgi:putative transposase
MVHRKTIRHVHKPGHLHELTFSCYGRPPLLNNDSWRAQLARCIDQAGDEEKAPLAAFVFMPEHVHLLVHFVEPVPLIGRYLARIKQPFSKQIKQTIAREFPKLASELVVQERAGKICFRFWQAGPEFDRNLFSGRAIESSLNYTHANPVRRGLCNLAVDWKWSSARFYLADPCGRQYDELPHLSGLPPGATA